MGLEQGKVLGILHLEKRRLKDAMVAFFKYFKSKELFLN